MQIITISFPTSLDLRWRYEFSYLQNPRCPKERYSRIILGEGKLGFEDSFQLFILQKDV